MPLPITMPLASRESDSRTAASLAECGSRDDRSLTGTPLVCSQPSQKPYLWTELNSLEWRLETEKALSILWTMCFVEKRVKRSDIVSTNVAEVTKKLISIQLSASEGTSLPLRHSGIYLVGAVKMLAWKISTFLTDCRDIMSRLETSVLSNQLDDAGAAAAQKKGDKPGRPHLNLEVLVSEGFDASIKDMEFLSYPPDYVETDQPTVMASSLTDRSVSLDTETATQLAAHGDTLSDRPFEVLEDFDDSHLMHGGGMRYLSTVRDLSQNSLPMLHDTADDELGICADGPPTRSDSAYDGSDDASFGIRIGEMPDFDNTAQFEAMMEAATRTPQRHSPRIDGESDGYFPDADKDVERLRGDLEALRGDVPSLDMRMEREIDPFNKDDDGTPNDRGSERGSVDGSVGRRSEVDPFGVDFDDDFGPKGNAVENLRDLGSRRSTTGPRSVHEASRSSAARLRSQHSSVDRRFADLRSASEGVIKMKDATSRVPPPPATCIIDTYSCIPDTVISSWLCDPRDILRPILHRVEIDTAFPVAMSTGIGGFSGRLRRWLHYYQCLTTREAALGVMPPPRRPPSRVQRTVRKKTAGDVPPAESDKIAPESADTASARREILSITPESPVGPQIGALPEEAITPEVQSSAEERAPCQGLQNRSNVLEMISPLSPSDSVDTLLLEDQSLGPFNSVGGSVVYHGDVCDHPFTDREESDEERDEALVDVICSECDEESQEVYQHSPSSSVSLRNQMEQEEDDSSMGFSVRTRKMLRLLRQRSSRLSPKNGLQFFEMCRGHETDIVAPAFYEILVLKSRGFIDVKQDKAFESIRIKMGE